MARSSLTIILFLIISAASFAGVNNPPKPRSEDKCPVCGMFVSRYPDFLSSVVFADGSYVFFDGPKDLFQCYLDTQRYLPSKKKADISALMVTDYYNLAVIDARSAYFVAGSDVHGPMGNELIPFSKRVEANEFLKDHHGKIILRFDEVTPAMLKDRE
jgi:copper chaperone NosL